MASIRDKFKKIKIAPDISFARQSWIDRIEIYGWVWSDDRNDWSITVSSVQYWGSDLTKEQWLEYSDKSLAERKLISSGGLADVYQTRYNPDTDQFYYYDILGNPQINPINDPYNPTSSNTDILLKPNYDFSETVLDVLGNPIIPKNPQVGLYSSKNYFDGLSKKRSIYKKFALAKTETEKVKYLQERQIDLVVELKEATRLLSKAEGLPAKEQKYLTILSGALGAIPSPKLSIGITQAQIAGIAITLISSYAYSQTTGKRIKLLSEDILYLTKENQAIEEFVNQVSSDSGQSDKKIWYWIGGIAILGIITYLYFKYKD